MKEELNLHGLTVDEALASMESFMEEAYAVGLPKVRIVHGKGTGAVRSAVRQSLAKHPLVRAYRFGEPWEGGEGVTVVELGEKTSEGPEAE
jgi:DNA mismatch repair protein MutS2